MPQSLIDLRSDTVTLPSDAMRRAMADAPVGDDVYGEDPTVNRLEATLAERAGKQAGLFMPSGTQSNLVALMTHCARGDEYIVGQEAHTYRYEGGGAAVLGSIQPQPLENAVDGSIAIDRILAAVKPDDIHFARTRLIALENTISGRVLPMAYLRELESFAREARLALHLDGARVFNAAIRNERSLADECRMFDTVSICLSKGLGAPAGSVLVGTREQIVAARRWRKMLGGGLRQAGILAAAGLYALEHNVTRLAEDHRRAARLAAGLAGLKGLRVATPQTNIVFVEITPALLEPLARDLKEHGVVTTLRPLTRLVTHLNVDDAGIERAIAAFALASDGALTGPPGAAPSALASTRELAS